MIEKKTIIITGGLGLLGKKASYYFASKEFHVICIDISGEKKQLADNISYINFKKTFAKNNFFIVKFLVI